MLFWWAACPSVPWHRALREAEYADTRRLIGARHAELDAVHHRVTYCEAVLRLEHGADEGPAVAAGHCGASATPAAAVAVSFRRWRRLNI